MARVRRARLGARSLGHGRARDRVRRSQRARPGAHRGGRLCVHGRGSLRRPPLVAADGAASTVRILYIHQFFATRESSLGLIRSYEFARRWVEQGHEVTVITSASRLPDEYSDRLFSDGVIDGIRVRSVRVGYSNYMGTLRRMWSFATFMFGATWLAVTAGQHDVVFATSTPLTVGIPGWCAAALRRRPFVFEVRDLWPEAAIQMGAISRDGLV
ncbi:MAG: glycosyltransferase family 4 protein, partial [Actinobacteria bacterium]